MSSSLLLLLLSTSLVSLSFDACDCQDCCCFVVPDSKCSNPTTKHVIGLSKAGKALFLPLFSILASCVFPSSCCPSPLCFLLPCRARSSDLCRSHQIDTPQTTAATTETRRPSSLSCIRCRSLVLCWILHCLDQSLCCRRCLSTILLNIYCTLHRLPCV